jgi:septal ring factor EnvC (AmiA/AmiB activator)
VKRRFWLALLLLVVATPGYLHAQADRSDATDRRLAFQTNLDDLRSRISDDEKQLDRNKAAETASLQMLNRLDRDIAVRKEVVRTFENRIVQLRVERDSVFSQVRVLSRQIEALKEEYLARATHAYKYGRLNDLALIFSAGSINQMLVRVNYLTRFSDARRDRVEKMRSSTTALEARRAALLETLAHTEVTLGQSVREQEQLFDLKNNRQRVVADLRKKSGELEQQLEKRRAAEEALTNQLTALLAAERRRTDSAAPSSYDAAEYAALTGSFETNLGRLPWPAKGTLVERFGVQVNAEYGTRTTNQGIVVATSPGADVRAVFEGRVIGIDVMPVYGKYIMVSHGDYVTVYGNLSTVLVTAQQRLTAGQLVGKAGTNSEPYGSGYFFGLSKDGFVDPARWLR